MNYRMAQEPIALCSRKEQTLQMISRTNYRQAERADAYARVWKMMEVVQHLVLEVCLEAC